MTSKLQNIYTLYPYTVFTHFYILFSNEYALPTSMCCMQLQLDISDDKGLRGPVSAEL